MELPKFNIFWKGRNTGQVQSARNAKEAVKLACQRKVAGSHDKVTGKCNTPVAVVQLSGIDLKHANLGKWIRTRADGSRNTSVGDFTFRPQLKKLAKGNKF